MVGVLPNQKFMVTGDSLATITTSGYLNQVSLESNPLANTDILQVLYAYNLQTTAGTYGLFTVSIDGTGTITLALADLTGGVTLPTILNHLVVSTNTSGQLGNLTGTAINNGSVQAGASGVAGTLISFPATAARGSLVVAGVANTGNTTTTISNAAMGQASVISIPDPGAATANFLLNAGPQTMAAGSSIVLAKVNGTEAANAVTANGVAGAITTSVLTTAGGATYVITWTDSFITTTSVIGLTTQGGTNTTADFNYKVVPGAGTATLTITNLTAATALNGTIVIGYTVF
jgi:hypothetical protein